MLQKKKRNKTKALLPESSNFGNQENSRSYFLQKALTYCQVLT